MQSKEFIKALIEKDLEVLRSIPKSDTHSHSGLGMRFSTFNKWVGGNVNPPPKNMDGIAGLDNYIFNETMKYVDSKEGFQFLIEATIEDAILDGVTVLETSLDFSNITYYDRPELYFQYVKDLVDKYKCKIDFRPEIGVARGVNKESWDKWVKMCIDSGVFKSIDLYGAEEINNLALYKEYYDYARSKGLKTKVHVGEFGSAARIIETIEVINPMEIQHGINSIQDSRAVKLIKDRNIRLNICPTSNVRLGAVASIDQHPIKQLFNEGVSITINTDDLLLFDSSVTEEYMYLYTSGIFTPEELNEIRLNGLRA